MNSTEKAFSEAIAPYIKDNSKVLVAFSGGCDSLALLSLCRDVLGPERTVAVYVNHNIRGKAELESEIRLNEDNCTRLGVPLVVRTIDEGLVERFSRDRRGGIEDAARAIRYEILEEERLGNGCDLILTAHHRQDQIETIVMHLQKGSPVTSLKGISKHDDARHILRPLLGMGRPDLELYLKGKGLIWSTDSTNADESYRRNHIRQSLIPDITEKWPDFPDEILHLGRQAELEYEKARSGADLEAKSEICLDSLREMGLVSRIITLYCMWNSVFPNREMPMTLMERVLDAVCSKANCTVGSNMAVFSIYNGRLLLTDPSEDESYKAFEVRFEPSMAQSIPLPGKMGLLSGSEASACLDIDVEKALRLDPSKFAPNARVRFARVGDRIRLKRGSRMVMRLLQDMKVPATLRKRVPVIVDDEGVCALFGSVFGGKDRICVKFRTSLAPNSFPLYIVSKG